jgi:hypothetical protein
MQGMPLQSNSNLVGEWLEAGGGATYSNTSLCAGEHGRGDKDGETKIFEYDKRITSYTKFKSVVSMNVYFVRDNHKITALYANITT